GPKALTKHARGPNDIRRFTAARERPGWRRTDIPPSPPRQPNRRRSALGAGQTGRRHGRPSTHVRTIESPCTATFFASSGRVAGPLATEPSSLNRLPWQGQLIVPPWTLVTAQPA